MSQKTNNPSQCTNKCKCLDCNSCNTWLGCSTKLMVIFLATILLLITYIVYQLVKNIKMGSAIVDRMMSYFNNMINTSVNASNITDQVNSITSSFK
jgi:hypothetical protein